MEKDLMMEAQRSLLRAVHAEERPQSDGTIEDYYFNLYVTLSELAAMPGI